VPFGPESVVINMVMPRPLILSSNSLHSICVFVSTLYLTWLYSPKNYS